MPKPKTPPLSVRLPPDLMERLNAEATPTNTRNAIMVSALRAHFDGGLVDLKTIPSDVPPLDVLIGEAIPVVYYTKDELAKVYPRPKPKARRWDLGAAGVQFGPSPSVSRLKKSK